MTSHHHYQPARRSAESTRAIEDVNENTPLLVTDAVAAGAGSRGSESATLDGNDANVREDDRPLPKLQLFLLCLARWLEPVAFFSIFPFVNKMCQRNGNLDNTDVGFYSGLIESLFSLTQMLVMIFWGKAADRFGRKPVLVFSLVGVSIASSTFGLATTIPEMILFRCLAGVFAGTIVTIRTMIAEISTPKTAATAFSYFAFVGNLGITFGPLIGGALAEPAEQFPDVFGDIPFFVDYPYALGSMVIGVIGILISIVCALFLEETLPAKTGSGGHGDGVADVAKPPNMTKWELLKLPGVAQVLHIFNHIMLLAFAKTGAGGRGDGEAEADVAKPPNMTMWELLKLPGVALVLHIYNHIMLLAFAYTAIAPVFWYTEVENGGLALTPVQISLFMGFSGLSQAFWTLVVFPPLQHRLGTRGILHGCAVVYPFFFLVTPVLNILLRADTPESEATFWIFAPIFLAIGSGVSMSFTAVQLALNDLSPNHESLGTLNAISLALVSGVRSFAPALFTSLFAIGARTQLAWGYMIWFLLALLSAPLMLETGRVPDYEKSKRQREELGVEASAVLTDEERAV
ncbi:MFS general substrate transporter [Thozetella sp. PMI_491]|nr:MFS general substrate transporter [Thozetella sp. PMI_491]